MSNSKTQQGGGSMNLGTAVLGMLVMFVGGVAIGHITGRVTSDPTAEIANAGSAGTGAAAAAPPGAVERLRVDVGPRMPAKGPADALVTLVIFSDYECPFCSRVEPTITRVMDTYRNQVRVVWRDNPLPMHENARPAAEAAREAYAQQSDAGFWRMHDTLMENQRSLTRADLERFAQAQGLDMTRFRAALDGHTHQAGIDADMQAASRVGARGTPYMFVNGRPVRGAVPFEQFQTVIDEEIRNAQNLLRSGTQRRGLYAAIMRTASETPAPPAANPNAQPQRRPGAPDPAAVYNIPVAGSPARGPADALVTVVLFSDFECPFCSRVEPSMTQLRERYPQDVRIVWKDYPLPMHPNAPGASEAAREIFQQRGADAFWRFHDVLIQNQRALTRADLERYATELGGINMAQFRQSLDSHEHQAAVQADTQLGAARGVTGTPASFINGRFLSGAQPFEAFQRLVDEELAKARERVQGGTPRARVYDAIMATGLTAVAAAPAAPAAAPQADPNADRVFNLAVPTTAPTRGPARAPVTIQIASDFECPFCGRVLPTIEQVVERYGQQVRFVWRNYPLPMHPNAPVAAEASLEVFAQRGSEAFWQYHNVLFQNQRALTRADLERYAEQLGGVNMARFRTALDNHTHQAAVAADQAAINGSGAQIGTPSFFINGRLLQGAQPFEQFQAAIDRAIAEAGRPGGARPAAAGAAPARPAAARPAARPAAAPAP